LYEDLKTFLEEYFCSPYTNEEEEKVVRFTEEDKWCSSLENGLTRSTYY